MSGQKPIYDQLLLANLRRGGMSWEEIRATYYPTAKRGKQLSDSHAQWKAKGRKLPIDAEIPPEVAKDCAFEQEVVVPGAKFRDVRTLDDLLNFFSVDLSTWEVKEWSVVGTEWDQNAAKGITAQAVKIKARFIRKFEKQVEDLHSQWEEFLVDAREHAPIYAPVEHPKYLSEEDDPVLVELAIFDPHFGMKAWAKEVGGVDYDLEIAETDYAAAVVGLLRYARMYPTERLLYIVGNDLQHADGPAGNSVGGATARGTMQEMDTRLAKIFTHTRRALVAGIDQAREISPVDVLIVRGNHDPQQTHRMGEVLGAWYRNDNQVNVINTASKRVYYGYGKNALMFTHGEEYRRQRDSLPLIMADECPSDLWVNSRDGLREIHTGHNHASMAGRYVPMIDQQESRGVRTRSLSGFTPIDTWHYEEGYKHKRAASVLAFRKSGSLAGIHEVSP